MTPNSVTISQANTIATTLIVAKAALDQAVQNSEAALDAIATIGRRIDLPTDDFHAAIDAAFERHRLAEEVLLVAKSQYCDLLAISSFNVSAKVCAA